VGHDFVAGEGTSPRSREITSNAISRGTGRERGGNFERENKYKETPEIGPLNGNDGFVRTTQTSQKNSRRMGYLKTVYG